MYLPATQYSGQLIRTPDSKVRKCYYLATLLKEKPLVDWGLSFIMIVD
jgi:hypothetical protein